ncbi:aldehyde dehydrogenase family protein [Niallia endozanthoxylica]|uniref:aldehyde dehydrogenase family protein n=1 Tax=Niallia endozanthoxylica TaxID=2036016 RepID=UPI00168BF305|nr:aldehyde dehydrogenase family protein [Niallia endozanthoxylica]
MSINQVNVHQIDLWINHEDVKTDQYIEVVDPGRLTDRVGTIAQGRSHHVDQAVKAAHQAFLSWRDTPLEQRIQLLLDAADILQKNSNEYATLLTRETGMLLSACTRDIMASTMSIRETVKLAQEFFEPQYAEDEHTRIQIEKVPLGVVAAITPWNVPMGIAMGKVAPILITGNTVVLKPSPNASLAVSLAFREISKIFPPGVINIVHGDSEVGEALTSHPLVRKITLTGGERTAISIMKSAADSLKRVHFELGGNDPAIILDDANLEEALQQISDLTFRRSGQVCVATKRIYLPEKLYEDACEIFMSYVNQYKIGHGLNPDATFGPVNNQHQYRYVKSLIEKARQYARVTELGTKLEPDNWNNGYYIHPTVVTHVKNHQEIVQCEQFGPVVPLVSYQNEEEVLRMVNDTEYGLGSSVWTSDYERGLSIAKKIEAGCTGINGSIDSLLGMNLVPFGGVKRSGIGWERGMTGLNEYVNYHSITYHKSRI